MWATLVIVFIAFGFWLLYRFNQVVFLLLIAVMIGTVIRPIVTWLNRLDFLELQGSLLSTFCCSFCSSASCYYFFPLILDQGGNDCCRCA